MMKLLVRLTVFAFVCVVALYCDIGIELLLSNYPAWLRIVGKWETVIVLCPLIGYFGESFINQLQQRR